MAALFVLGVCCIFTPETLPGIPICWFAKLTHLPCPGCGLTRSLCCIGHGECGQAWDLNPFGFIFFPMLVLCALGGPVTRVFPAFEDYIVQSRPIRVLPLFLVAAMLVFGAVRLYRVAYLV